MNQRVVNKDCIQRKRVSPIIGSVVLWKCSITTLPRTNISPYQPALLSRCCSRTSRLVGYVSLLEGIQNSAHSPLVNAAKRLLVQGAPFSRCSTGQLSRAAELMVKEISSQSFHGGNCNIYPDRIHGNGTFPYINGWFFMVNVGKYTSPMSW